MSLCERLLHVLEEGGVRGGCCAPLADGHAPGRLRLKAPQPACDALHMLSGPLQNLSQQQHHQHKCYICAFLKTGQHRCLLAWSGSSVL